MRVMSVADTVEVTEEAMAFDVDASYSTDMVKGGGGCSGPARIAQAGPGCTSLVAAVMRACRQ